MKWTTLKQNLTFLSKGQCRNCFNCLSCEVRQGVLGYSNYKINCATEISLFPKLHRYYFWLLYFFYLDNTKYFTIVKIYCIFSNIPLHVPTIFPVSLHLCNSCSLSQQLISSSNHVTILYILFTFLTIFYHSDEPAPLPP